MIIINNPLRIDDLHYKIEDETIYIKHKNKVYKTNFSGLVDGKLNTSLDFIPFTEKTNGELTITIRQPVDSKGTPIEYDSDFEITECEEVVIDWKTQEEIDELNNQPHEPTAEERLQAVEEALLFITLGGM